MVEEELRRLEHLVSDFLAFVHPRPLDLRPAVLTELCNGVLSFVAPEATAAGVRLHALLSGALSPAPVDAERLRQVLLNLVRNAIEAMPEGGDLTVRTRNAERTIELEIEDTGKGFPDESPVFDAFFTTKPKGTGLGLTIAHRIVTDHGGSIRVRSRPGSTIFTISLPTA
jgi:signal transduction histidine kinase